MTLVAEPTARSFAVRVAAFYAALFVVYGVQIPFLPLWLSFNGLTEGQVAIVTAVPFLLRLGVTPACAIAADRIGDQRRIVIWLSWLGFASALILSQATGFAAILLLYALFALATATIMPLTEAIAVQGVRRHQLDYGRMRLWGSLSFIAVGLLVGLLKDRVGLEAAIWTLVAGTLATAIVAHSLPPAAPGPKGDDTGDEGAPQYLFDRLALWRLFGSASFALFMIAASVTQAAHAMFYTFGAMHWQSLGISGTATGALWATAVIAEVALFAFAGPWLRHFEPAHLLAIGSAAAVVRWLAMSFDPPVSLLVPLQMLHALTYGATHLGAIEYIRRNVPHEAAGTAQALYATLAAGLVMGIVTLASGPLYKAFQGSAFASMAVLSALALVAALALSARKQT